MGEASEHFPASHCSDSHLPQVLAGCGYDLCPNSLLTSWAQIHISFCSSMTENLGQDILDGRRCFKQHPQIWVVILYVTDGGTAPCPPGRHVRGTPVVSLEFLAPAVCRVPAFLTYRTAALLRMGPWQMSRVSWNVHGSLRLQDSCRQLEGKAIDTLKQCHGTEGGKDGQVTT